MGTDPTTLAGGSARSFGPTLWTIVLTAKDPASPHRRAALETLITTYWKPLYYFVRHRGNDSETSKDVTQGFFTALIEKNYLQNVAQGRGKFRTFLLTAIQHYLSDYYDRAAAKKRGGGVEILALDFGRAEDERVLPGVLKDTPDDLFRREWALEVLSQGLKSLRKEYETAGRLEEFEWIRLHLQYGASAGSRYSDLASKLGLSESDVRNRIHRARVRLREATLDVIRAYTQSEADTEEELRDLLGAFSQG